MAAGVGGSTGPPHLVLSPSLQNLLEGWTADTTIASPATFGSRGEGLDADLSVRAVAAELSSLYLREQDRRSAHQPQMHTPLWQIEPQGTTPSFSAASGSAFSSPQRQQIGPSDQLDLKESSPSRRDSLHNAAAHSPDSHVQPPTHSVSF